MEQMKSLILEQIDELKFEEIPEPVPNEGEAIVRVKRCALCRTDAKIWAHGHRDLVLPRILGHEICGIREDTNERVVVWPGEACGKCAHCLTGAENLCNDIKILGFSRDGGFAEKVAVKKSSLLRLSDNLDDDVACLAEPLACAINALQQAKVTSGDSVLIFGAGSVGLLLALAADAIGASPFIAEINLDKLHKSESFRARLGIHGLESPDSRYFDVAINACPSLETLSQGISRLGKGGRFCLFSGFNQDVNFSARALNEVHYRQLHVIGAYGCARNHVEIALTVLDTYQETVRLLIDEQITLEKVPSALRRILRGQAFKIEVFFL